MNKNIFLAAALLGCASPVTLHAESPAVPEMAQVQAVAAESRTVHVETAGTLKTLITTQEIQNLSNLKVTGEINSDDISYIANGVRNAAEAIALDFGEAVSVDGELGKYVFFNCDKLVGIVLPQSLTRIDENAFYGCSKLISVHLPQSLTNIGNSAFCEMPYLLSVRLPRALLK